MVFTELLGRKTRLEDLENLFGASARGVVYGQGSELLSSVPARCRMYVHSEQGLRVNGGGDPDDRPAGYA